MAKREFSGSALVDAPADIVYGVIADYDDGHQRIVPNPPFETIRVVRGGRGDGTIIEVGVRVMGVRQAYTSVISEPEPGRVLVESNDNGYVTTFTVEPRSGGRQALVTISSEAVAGGPLAGLQHWFIRRLMQPVFARELAQLESVARARAAARPAPTEPAQDG